MKEKILIQRIEEVTGQHYDSPKDFDKLSQQIFFKTEEMVSPSTLKRLWGYIDSASSPRSYTLDVLAGENGGYPPTKNGGIRSLLCA